MTSNPQNASGYQPIESENALSTMVLRILNSILAFPKTFLFTLVFPTVIVMVIVVFFIDPKFGSKSVFQPPASQSAASGLSSMLGEGGSAIADMMGLNLMSSGEADIVQTLLNSRELHQATINKFDLGSHYKFKGKFPADLLKTFRNNISIDVNDEKMFVLRVEDEDYKLATTINRFMISWTDSAYNAIKSRQARLSGNFFRTRLDTVLKRTDSLTNSMVVFQKKNQFFEPDIQLEAGLKILTELDAERSTVQLDLEAEEATHGLGTSKQKQLSERLGLLTSQIQAKNNGNLGIGLPSGLNHFAELSKQYYELEREIKVQNALYKYLRQKVEELDLTESKNMKNLVILEEPWENNKRVSPPRMAITVLMFLLSGILGVWICSILAFIQKELSSESAFAREWSTTAKRLRSIIAK